MPPSLGLINLREGLTGLKNRVYSLGYQFITQQPDKEIHRVRSQTKQLRSQFGVQHGGISSMVACGRAVVHQLGSSPNHVLWGVYGSSITQASLIESLPLTIDSTSSPFPLPGGQGGGTESFNPLTTCLVHQATSPQPQVGSKSHLWNLT